MELLFKNPNEYIKFELELRRSRRPSYSMRAFARDLNISPSGLNDFLKGRVGMSPSRVESIASTLRWSSWRKDYFLDLIIAQFSALPEERRAASRRIKLKLKEQTSLISVEQFKLISHWYYFVIVEICSIQPNVDARFLAENLKLPLTAINRALSTLLKMGLLNKTCDGYKPLRDESQVGDEAPSEAIQAFHSQILSLAQQALTLYPMEERESQSFIFSTNSTKIPQLHKEIKAAILTTLSKYTEENVNNQVQVFTFQSFPAFRSEGAK